MLYPGEFKSLNKIPNVDIDKLIHISLSINITWALFSPANGSKDLKKYIIASNVSNIVGKVIFMIPADLRAKDKRNSKKINVSRILSLFEIMLPILVKLLFC
jgi:hypothetical protein